jgi:Zonular occludens toxin (Zot)
MLPLDEETVLTVDETVNGKINCTVRKHARSQQLQGSLCCLNIEGKGAHQRVLCRVGMINTTNPAHSNPTYAPIIMESGSVPFFSAEADIERTTLEVLACFDLYEKRLMGRKANPSSGTPVCVATQADLAVFPNEQEFYAVIGSLPGYPDVTITLRNRHYGSVLTGGSGEGKHKFYFGQNGSWKTCVLQMQLATRACQHKELGVFICDTKSDFVLDGKHNRPGIFSWSLHQVLKRGGRKVTIVAAKDIRLTGVGVLYRLLVDFIHHKLNSTEDKANHWVWLLLPSLLKDKEEVEDLTKITALDFLRAAGETCAAAFSTKTTRDDKFMLLQHMQANPSQVQRWWQQEVVPYFEGRYTPERLVQMALKEGAFLIVDIDDKHVINRTHQNEIMRELFAQITAQAKDASRKDIAVNAEIVLDEAFRWIPQGEKRGPSEAIIDAVNTTRAFNVGWTFLSQRIAAVDKDVVAQCHTIYYGRGLGIGADRKHMETELGVEGLALYDMLDREGGGFFIAQGYEVNFGSEGIPLAFQPFSGDATEKLMALNPHIWSKSGW